MKNIKNKKQLLEYLDKLINKDKKFKMPKFSDIASKSKKFNSEYKNLIFFIKKRNKSFLDEMKFDEIILNTYFFSTEVRTKIKQLNNEFYKKINNLNIQKPIFKKQKSIYKDINL